MTSPLAFIPSWFISLTLHVLLLAGIASGLKSCEGSLSGQEDGDMRTVGIYVKQPEGLVEKSVDETDTSNTDTKFPSAFTAADSPAAVDDAPPADLMTPAINKPPDILGPGVSPSTSSGSDAREFIRPGGGFRSTRVGELAQGETTFFDIRDTGTHFVYLLDASGSMAGISMLAAKAELKKSIAALDATQQFQIIFYNDKASVLRLPRAADVPMIWATEINKTLARQSINNVVPGGGTDHMPALKKALSLRPEVIYFLTDADSVLRSGDLDKIKRTNQGRARIHCIEFGEGADLQIKPLNFLKRLARQSGGTYRYRDVTQFRRKK